MHGFGTMTRIIQDGTEASLSQQKLQHSYQLAMFPQRSRVGVLGMDPVSGIGEVPGHLSASGFLMSMLSDGGKREEPLLQTCAHHCKRRCAMHRVFG